MMDFPNLPHDTLQLNIIDSWSRPTQTVISTDRAATVWEEGQKQLFFIVTDYQAPSPLF